MTFKLPEPAFTILDNEGPSIPVFTADQAPMPNSVRTDPVPAGAEIMASYKVIDDPLRRAKVCKYGCCMDMGFGPQMLPRYWRWAEPDEIGMELGSVRAAASPKGCA